MKSLALPSYNRPEYFIQTLESLKECHDYHLFICFDYSDKTEELRAIAESFSHKFAQIHIAVNNPRVGMVQNAYDNIEWTFRMGSEFVCCIEDDLYLSPDFLLLMDWYIETFKDNSLQYGAYGAQGGNVQDATPDGLLLADYFTGNGWGVFKENWEEYFVPYWFKTDLGIKHFGPGGVGNDWNISGLFREKGLKMPFPELARSKHMGKTGYHFYPEVYEELCGHLICNTEHVITEFKLNNIIKGR